MRADFNNDGFEDVLVFRYSWLTKNTLRFGGLMVLTRTSMNEKFEVVHPS